ncbi:MAG: DEAD/DEAH box helicase [Nitrososphaerales archaeon]
MIQRSAFEFLSEKMRRALLEAKILVPTPPQEDAIPRLVKGESALIFAPTGSGKTEAALFPILNSFLKERPAQGISIIYITPMRALNRDLLYRLNDWSRRLNFSVEVRHGDTPTSQRRKQSINPPDLLVTTPETLQAILPSKSMRRHLSTVRFVIVDEVHAIVESKRGAQLSIGLERLRKIITSPSGLQIIGLSATVGTPVEAAKFLSGTSRNVAIIESRASKQVRYFLEYPSPNEDDHAMAQTLFTAPEAAARIGRMIEMIESHQSTLIFVNSRSVAEMLGAKLNMVRKDVAVHHGSLPREERERIEAAFKNGKLRAMVCTSTLELGIDIGSVDLAIQYMSPRQVSSLIQRVGRSGHALTKDSEGVILAVSADDVLEGAAAVELATSHVLEPLKLRRNSLDVLAHQIVGLALDLDGTIRITEAFSIIRGAYPFRDLPEEVFHDILNYMENLRIVKSDETFIHKAWRSKEYYFQNLSMIPDEKRYPVIDLTTQQKVGILGVEFVLLKAKVGLNFVCKGKVWRIENISDDAKVYVTPAEDPLAVVPGWDGEILPVHFQLAQRTGQLRRKISRLLGENERNQVIKMLKDVIPGERNARKVVVDELADHIEIGAPVPDDRTILIEGYDRYLIVHGCFGEAINRTFGHVFEEILAAEGLLRYWWADGYRILFELTVETDQFDLEGLVRTKLFSMDSDQMRKTFFHRLEKEFPFPERLKNIAQRFGIYKRGQFLGHPQLCSLGSRFANTPVYQEGLNEVLTDLIDLPGTLNVLDGVQDGTIGLNFYLSGERPTPIGYHILYRHLDVPELVAPDSIEKSNVERMRMALENRFIDLVCFQCGSSLDRVMVKQLGERPSCVQCGSGLLALAPWSSRSIKLVIGRKLAHEKINEAEQDALTKARRSADIILSYGKKGILALSVYGIGPQSAAKVLAKMHDDDTALFKDLMEAKLKFITTRQYWANQ